MRRDKGSGGDGTQNFILELLLAVDGKFDTKFLNTHLAHCSSLAHCRGCRAARMFRAGKPVRHQQSRAVACVWLCAHCRIHSACCSLADTLHVICFGKFLIAVRNYVRWKRGERLIKTNSLFLSETLHYLYQMEESNTHVSPASVMTTACLLETKCRTSRIKKPGLFQAGRNIIRHYQF